MIGIILEMFRITVVLKVFVHAKKSTFILRINLRLIKMQ